MPSARHSGRLVTAALAAAVLVTALAGCTSGPGPEPGPEQTTAAPTGSPTATAAPVFTPNGTAADNLAFFDYTNNQTIQAAGAANQTPDGVAFTTALRAAGFSVADMQVTPDITTVGVKADSIQFSVAMQGQCLIGQYGFGEYHSLVTPVLGSGTCLIGETRPIDW
ncbi:DUF6993 domain-containing protein [Subtercola sp. YIM 133946]|uniref:DUF6993 domain-containing protein n=1 Tax=Subtercola sp. YIM 133946 TaxID=3118909 RepID=UPI002F9556A0